MTDDVLPLSAPVTTRSGDKVDRIVVSKGTTVVVPIRCINKSTSIWGPNAKEFVPERWVNDAGITAKAKEFQGFNHLLSFGDGPRTCLGRGFALAEFKVCLEVDFILCTIFHYLSSYIRRCFLSWFVTIVLPFLTGLARQLNYIDPCCTDLRSVVKTVPWCHYGWLGHRYIYVHVCFLFLRTGDGIIRQKHHVVVPWVQSQSLYLCFVGCQWLIVTEFALNPKQCLDLRPFIAFLQFDV